MGNAFVLLGNMPKVVLKKTGAVWGGLGRVPGCLKKLGRDPGCLIKKLAPARAKRQFC